MNQVELDKNEISFSNFLALCDALGMEFEKVEFAASAVNKYIVHIESSVDVETLRKIEGFVNGFLYGVSM